MIITLEIAFVKTLMISLVIKKREIKIKMKKKKIMKFQRKNLNIFIFLIYLINNL